MTTTLDQEPPVADTATSAQSNDDEPTAAADEPAVAVDLPPLPTLISVTRAATVLGISRASAYRYAACGDLPTVRLGGRLYIVSARLRAFLAAA